MDLLYNKDLQCDAKTSKTSKTIELKIDLNSCENENSHTEKWNSEINLDTVNESKGKTKDKFSDKEKQGKMTASEIRKMIKENTANVYGDTYSKSSQIQSPNTTKRSISIKDKNANQYPQPLKLIETSPEILKDKYISKNAFSPSPKI